MVVLNNYFYVATELGLNTIKNHTCMFKFPWLWMLDSLDFLIKSVLFTFTDGLSVFAFVLAVAFIALFLKKQILKVKKKEEKHLQENLDQITIR